ncbi:hypothetical protein BdWA1_000273 [Babesia duncani]|uniref:Uncharacterized protein n=1 Tax=Babesia duncani TaxID=323732 RepID=A0AAD9UPV9_9APIC|nr:hypothetical protein BdWA1_000273 [Babesia duncani]
MAQNDESESKSLESKYKSLKWKHGVLKDAFKTLHADFEQAQVEIDTSKKNYNELLERNENLQKAYDNLTQEVIEIQNQLNFSNNNQPHVPAASPIYIPNKDSAEINKLKSHLDAITDKHGSFLYEGIMHADYAQSELQQLRKLLESKEIEYNGIVTELKERILVCKL